MRAKSLRVALGLGLFSLIAWGLPACSDDDEGGGKAGSAGTGGSAGSAGAGGSSGTGGSGGGGPAVCGGTTCETWKVGSVVDVAGCCVGGGDTCGVDVTQTLTSLVGIPKGCYELNQPGFEECACPRSPEFINPLSGDPASFPGCCRPDGTCGYFIDLEGEQGPMVGCMEAWDKAGSPDSCTPLTAPNPCPEDGGTDGGSDAGAGDASTD